MGSMQKQLPVVIPPSEVPHQDLYTEQMTDLGEYLTKKQIQNGTNRTHAKSLKTTEWPQA